MAWEGTFATQAECDVKAGKNVSDDLTEARKNDLILQAESVINCMTRYNWTDVYSSLNADVKRILSETASNLVGIYMISYYLNDYSRCEAETMINVLRDGFLRSISVLRDKKTQEFINGA